MTVFAYIAHKDGYWGGVCSPRIGAKSLAKWLAGFIRSGFDIMPVASREEYLATLDRMQPWFDRPEARLARANTRRAT
jgi:hypothetical protein